MEGVKGLKGEQIRAEIVRGRKMWFKRMGLKEEKSIAKDVRGR